MTPEQFVYWLQGYMELTEPNDLTQRERIIADHLKEVFEKRTPDRTGGTITVTPSIPYMPNGNGDALPNNPTFIC